MISRPLEQITITDQPLNAETPLRALLNDETPNQLFYIRNHFDIPEINPDAWHLCLAGAEGRELQLNLPEIQALPKKHLLVLMECAGNGRTSMLPQPNGTPWNLGAVSQATFTGTPLRNVLERLDISPDILEVLFIAADKGQLPSGQVEPYARSLPIEVALHPDTLLAWGMNGEPLSLEHGYPLRLLVPGWYGMASVKWLKEIALLTARFAGQFQTEEYIFQNEPGIENGHPVTAMWVRSLILAPQDKEILEKNPVEISGIAWSGEGEIAGVEISVDGGENWQAAQLERAISAYGFRRWRFRWQPEKPGSCTLASRATDSSGKTQPMQPRGNTLGYGNNVIHQINVNVA